MDNRKILTITYISAGLVAWFLSRAFIFWLHTTFYQIRRLPGILVIRETLPFLVGIAVGVALFANPVVTAFCEEVVSELRKVTWPNRDEVARSTWVVMICILICSFILAGFDLLWGKMIGFLLGS